MTLSFARKLLWAPVLAAILTASNPSVFSAPEKEAYFIAAPYVQLGYHYKGDNLTVCWLTEDANTADILFEYKTAAAKDWQKANKIETGELNGFPKLRLHSVEMSSLPPDTMISYRISKTGKSIFEAAAQSVPAAGSPFDFAVFGDVGQGSEGEARIAALLKEKHPAMSIITGDIVYPIGSVRNYLNNFFPFLNSSGGKAKGSPLLRSMLAVGVAGNHDLTEGGVLDARDLELAPDSMAYFTFWKQPLNGPTTSNSTNIAVPRGDKSKVDAFPKAASVAYPCMTNFSFDYGDCHILVLDGNSYMDWTDGGLRKWVETDLKNSQAQWKFVAFHQPGFNSDWAHREEQRMRHLSDIFERTGVDVCFSGHSHSYQRSFPIHFKESSAPESDREAKAGFVFGTFKIDKAFDGSTNTKPDGVIYVVSGGGGARLSNPEIEIDPGQWQPFTKIFASKEHSITMCHVEGKRFHIQQLGEDGKTLDQFTITK